MNTAPPPFKNPFRPGAGHMPPYLAGRKEEAAEFLKLLQQAPIMQNLILTGLRGVGKTVLSETFKPLAIQNGWLWVGADLSEAISVSEANLAIRIMADISLVTSALNLDAGEKKTTGFTAKADRDVVPVNFAYLAKLYENTPGLATDKLKAVLEFVWSLLQLTGHKGIVFAYDEAQTLADNAAKDQYPLSVLLDTFQSIQRKGVPFMLAFVGLPTLFPQLVEARAYAERMFHVIELLRLSDKESHDAIVKPIESAKCPVKFTPDSVALVVEHSGGYPYFIQFICRELYDIWLSAGSQLSGVPATEITRKLDTDFFAGRWARATDRQRELMNVIAHLQTCDGEFSVQEIVEKSVELLGENKFSNSHVNQMLGTLANSGLVYKNRRGKYSFAVPLMSGFIRRQYAA
jgi:hypothetical protein